jgi:hypothetical protein
MSIASLSGLPNQQSPGFYNTRKNDLVQLNNAIQSGDLAGARQAYQAVIKLGHNGPFQDKKPFALAPREQAFAAIGHALQSGDLAAAQHGIDVLHHTFVKPALDPPPPAAAPGGPVVSSNVSFVA